MKASLTQTLTTKPHENIHDVIYELNNYCKRQGTKWHQYGVFGAVATDPEWLALAGNDAGGNPIPRPVFELPPDLAANAAGALVAQNTRQKERFEEYSAIMVKIKEEFMVVVGQVNIV